MIAERGQRIQLRRRVLLSLVGLLWRPEDLEVGCPSNP
jgi:hypothetical protein